MAVFFKEKTINLSNYPQNKFAFIKDATLDSREEMVAK
jgi:hypothetical protein